jgi:hypothetical protein
MSIDTANTAADAEIAADLEAVLKHVSAGAPVDSALSRRVRARSQAMTEDLRRKYGELNVAVDLIRAVRDEP